MPSSRVARFSDYLRQLPRRYRKMLDSVVFRDYKKIEEILETSVRKRREVGLSVCYDPKKKKFFMSRPTVGEESSVMIKGCPKDTVKVGDVHTHLPEHEHGDYHVRLSAGDIISDFYYRKAVSCVVAPVYGDVVRHEYEPRGYVQQVRLIYDTDTAVKCYCYDTTHPKYEKYRRKIVELADEYYEAFDEYEKAIKNIPAGESIPKDLVERLSKATRRVYDLFEEAKREGIVTEGCKGVRIRKDGTFLRKHVEDLF